MADEVVIEQPVVETKSFFNEDNWSVEPTVVEPVIETVVEEPIVVVPTPVVETVTEPIVVEPTPAVVEEPLKKVEFKNEISEKAYKSLVDGDFDKVREYLNEQHKLSTADKLTPSEQIKLHLEYANKDKGYTAAEVNDIFNEKYELPEVPEQGANELDDDFEKREAKYKEQVSKIEARIARDAKAVILEIDKFKQEIVLPYEPKEQPATVKELTQEELDIQNKEAELFVKSAEDAVQKFSGYETAFKDGEVEIKVAAKVTDEQKKEVLSLVNLSSTDAPSFLKKLGWLSEEGKLDSTKLVKDLPLILYGADYFKQIAEDSSNKKLAEAEKAVKNIDFSGGKKPVVEGFGKTSEQATKEFGSAFFGD